MPTGTQPWGWSARDLDRASGYRTAKALGSWGGPEGLGGRLSTALFLGAVNMWVRKLGALGRFLSLAGASLCCQVPYPWKPSRRWPDCA